MKNETEGAEVIACGCNNYLNKEEAIAKPTKNQTKKKDKTTEPTWGPISYPASTEKYSQIAEENSSQKIDMKTTDGP